MSEEKRKIIIESFKSILNEFARICDTVGIAYSIGNSEEDVISFSVNRDKESAD